MTDITSTYTDDQLNTVMKAAKRNGLTLTQHQHDLTLFCSAMDNNAHPDPVPQPQPTTPMPVGPPGSWKPLWSDEFDGNALDRSKWNVLDHSTYGSGNSEEEGLLAANVAVVGGSLHIVGKREQYDTTHAYTSGFVTTRGGLGTGQGQTFKFCQGFAEIRARLPKGGGFWPAFWLVGADTAPGWPAYGEFDVMEAYGTYPNIIESTVHWAEAGVHKQKGGQALTVLDNTDWHTYGVLWTPNYLTFFIDGDVRQSFIAQTPDQLKALSYEHCIHLNLAIGGTGPRKYHGWDGTWKDGELPGTYEIEYCRVWSPA